MTQNLVSWIDRHLFPYHLYLYSPDHNVRDPEGLLSDLPAIGTALMGCLTGLCLCAPRDPSPPRPRASRIASLSSLARRLSLVARVSPEQKHVDQFLCSGCRRLLAGPVHLRLLRQSSRWTGARAGRGRGCVFGSNAIAAYMFSELTPGIFYNISVSDGSGQHVPFMAWLFTHFFAHIPNPHWAAFAYSVSFTTFCFIPVWILYRRKIFLKV